MNHQKFLSSVDFKQAKRAHLTSYSESEDDSDCDGSDGNFTQEYYSLRPPPIKFPNEAKRTQKPKQQKRYDKRCENIGQPLACSSYEQKECDRLESSNNVAKAPLPLYSFVASKNLNNAQEKHSNHVSNDNVGSQVSSSNLATHFNNDSFGTYVTNDNFSTNDTKDNLGTRVTKYNFSTHGFNVDLRSPVSSTNLSKLVSSDILNKHVSSNNLDKHVSASNVNEALPFNKVSPEKIQKQNDKFNVSNGSFNVKKQFKRSQVHNFNVKLQLIDLHDLLNTNLNISYFYSANEGTKGNNLIKYLYITLIFIVNDILNAYFN